MILIHSTPRLTLLDRYLIYSEMLLSHEKVKVNNNRSSSGRFGLCDSLHDVWWSNKNRYDLHTPLLHLRDLPELLKKRPKKHDVYWFNPFDQEIRIKILKSCIREVIRKMKYDFDNY